MLPEAGESAECIDQALLRQGIIRHPPRTWVGRLTPPALASTSTGVSPSLRRSAVGGCVPCWAFYSESSARHGRQEFGSQDASLGELFEDPNSMGSGLGDGVLN